MLDADNVTIDPTTPELHQQIVTIGRHARDASRSLAELDGASRGAVLRAMAGGIDARSEAILEANAGDVVAARAAGLGPAMIDRLALDPDRIGSMSQGLRDVAGLPDLLGETISTVTRPNGLVIRKVRVPIGVIGMIYESRPNVTADAAGLCLKAGNAVILRGGSETLASNMAILDAMNETGAAAGLPPNAVQLVPTTDRAAVRSLLSLDDLVDLIIPRGGETLIRAVAEHSRVPVLKHYKGVCHVYVDRAADLDMALRIAIDAKCQRPGVCNAMETLLVHRDVAETFLPRVAAALLERGVEIRGDRSVCAAVEAARPATDEDWSAEYLDLILSVGVVTDLDAAVAHIERYGSRHTDVIVTTDADAAARFARLVDSATVYVNASSRFTDGAEFGMGAEIGISTDKLHARGPCGIEALTTYKYVIEGSGQLRG